MQISSNNYNAYNQRPLSFKGSASKTTENLGKRSFDWFAKQCNVESNGSLTRGMFVSVAGLFMLGGRFIESRSEDEKREVLARDIPGVVTAVYGAPLLNAALAYGITKKSGIPIITLDSKKKNVAGANLASQKQVIDWYSDLSKLKDPLNTFSETIDRNGGNIRKVFKKLDLEEQFNKVVSNKDADNKTIIDTLKNAKKSEAFVELEKKLTDVGANKANKVLKTARRNQALVKLGGIGFTAALLGVIIPRLNIITTRNKYKKQQAEASQNMAVAPQQIQQGTNLDVTSASVQKSLNNKKLNAKQKVAFSAFEK